MAVANIICLLLVTISSSLALATGPEMLKWEQDDNTVTYVHHSSEGYQEIYFDGVMPLARGTLYGLMSAVDNLKPKTPILLKLNSGGGILLTFIKFYEELMIKCPDCGLTTYVAPNENCFSACVYIFMRGDVRLASQTAVFGFHSGSDPLTNELAGNKTADMEIEWGVNPDFVNRLREQGAFLVHEGTFLSGSELDGSGIVHGFTDKP